MAYIFSLFQKAEKQRIGRMAKLRLFLDFFVDYFLDTFLYFSTGCAICVLENSILAINGKCTELPAVFRKLCTFFYYCFIIGYPTFCTVILPSVMFFIVKISNIAQSCGKSSVFYLEKQLIIETCAVGYQAVRLKYNHSSIFTAIIPLASSLAVTWHCGKAFSLFVNPRAKLCKA